MKKLDSALLGAKQVKTPNRRLLRLASVIRQHLANIISRELEIPRRTLLTISTVEVLADYSAVKIGLVVWPTDQQEVVMVILNNNLKRLQMLLAQKLTMYRVPRLQVSLDESANKAARLEGLLDSLE
ncbi:ribosome-binding factor A [Patescibacteria group bacterium]|nr:ribosome-binding factor A [Patescibacteria group bacterium]